MLEGEQPYKFLTRARGASKTTDLAAVALALLLDADDAARLYWVGADSDQGKLAIDAIAGYVARTPSLADHVEIQTRRVLAIKTGAALDVLAADSAGAWGLKPAAVFADELANWADTTHPRRVWEAVSSRRRQDADAQTRCPDDGGRPRALLGEGLGARGRVAAVARPRGSRPCAMDGEPIDSPSRSLV